MKATLKPNQKFKDIDKTKIFFICLTVIFLIIGTILTTFIYIKGAPLHQIFKNFNNTETIKTIATVGSAGFTFISAMFAFLRNGTKKREKDVVQSGEKLILILKKVSVLNSKIKKLEKKVSKDA